MNEEKEIEDKIENTVFYAKKEAEKQADEFGYTGDKREFHILSTIAKVLVVAGYRKAEEVRKETAKRIYQRLYDLCTKDNPFGAYDLLKEDVLGWAKEDGVEIEECKTVDFEDIEQSDVIELPCKMQIPHVKGVDVFMYQVLWRSNDGSGFVSQRFFNTEPEADAFLAELKGGKK